MSRGTTSRDNPIIAVRRLRSSVDERRDERNGQQKCDDKARRPGMNHGADLQ
jgi:hypothetical protein